MRNKFFISGMVTLALAFAFIFTGCDTGTNDNGGNNGNPPVSTKSFISDGNGFIQYSTNDPQKYNSAFWNFYGNINDTNTYEIECKKLSGAGGYGYGMLFGASDDDNYKYYYLAIFIDGTYSIDKNNGDVLTEIKPLEKSDKLHTGYNITNVLKVVKNGAEYTVYLNGSQEYQFTDTEISGNRVGCRVRIGSESDESFPNTPVDVRFRQRYGNGNNGNLPVSTIEWESDENGFIQYSTNDPQKYGLAYWHFYMNINGQNTYEIEYKKMNGAGNVAYGMVFGASDTDNNRFYHLGIDIYGEYSLWKYIDNKWTRIKDWAYSEKLNTGYNKINNLKAVKNGTTFTVYLNGSQVHQFTDTEISGNRFGYYVEIGTKNNEAFPNMPVDVRFRQKDGSDGGDLLVNQFNGIWKAGNENITLNNGSFVISENNRQNMRGTYTAAARSISANLTMHVKELHGDYLSEIEEGGPTFESKWYSKNQVIDAFREWLKEDYPSLTDTEITVLLNGLSAEFDAMFPTKTAAIDGDTMTLDGTTYTKVTGGY